MSEGSLRKFLFVPVAFLLSTCAPMQQQTQRTQPVAPSSSADRCASSGLGNAERKNPIVCVGMTADGKVTVDPDTIESWDTTEPNGHTKHVILWMARDPKDDLQIRMKKEGCVDPPACHNGQCKATAKDVSKEEGSRQCPYSIFLNKAELDPDVIIIDCCSDSAPPP